jgi:hypothetical protein
MNARKSMQEFLKGEGIIHHTTCVNTPEQNGVAERNNRHILEVTRCLLFSMNVPRYLWGEATKTAVYLINRMPLRAVEFHTPLEILTGKNAFKVSPKTFGCVCFVHNTTRGLASWIIEPISVSLWVTREKRRDIDVMIQ